MLFVSEHAAIIEAAAAALSAIVAVLLFTVARRQTTIAQIQATAQRLEAFREIVRHHHDPRMRELRRVVRVDLIDWFGKHKSSDMDSVDWIRIKSSYEDVMNYYEYLGSLLRDHLTEEEILLRMVHNSAVAIWDQVHVPYGDRIRQSPTKAKDYAGDFEYLVNKARKYRQDKGLNQ